MLLYDDSQFVSPYAMSAFVSLREKEVPFDVEIVDLSANENQTTAFATKSITRRVPTLVHEGFSLSESSAISEYIDDIFPGIAQIPLHKGQPRCTC
jgi:glutathione S-transferase